MGTPVDLGGASGFVNPGQTMPMTVGASVSAGTKIVVFTADVNTHTGVTVTDSQGNSYASVFSYNPGTALGLQFWQSTITTPLVNGVDTITYTAAASTAQNLGIAACSLTGYTTADTGVSAGTQNSFTTSYTVTGSGAAVVNEIDFAFGTSNAAYSGTPAGWSTACAAMGAFTVLIMYQINSGTSGLTFAGNISTAQVSNQAIIAFEPTPPPFTNVGIIGLASSEW